MKRFSGVTTALITPFMNNQVDFNSLDQIITQQLLNHVDGFVVNGTTAESPTLEPEEVESIYTFVRKKTPANKKIILGAGSNSTKQTILSAKKAERLGADAVLVVVPYYNKPTQVGLFQHFKTVADSVDLPLILYNVPSRTITSLELETIKKLSQHPNIVGIKEASGNIDFAKKIRQECGSEFLLLSGDDGTYDQFIKVGGDGVISVASHIIPTQMKNGMISAHRDLIDQLFCEANPIPVKMALYLLGHIQSPELRLPLTTLSTGQVEKLKSIMRITGLI